MTSETVNQQQSRLMLARMNAYAGRNNSGAYQDETGRLVRYGLGNDSAALNAEIKSSDLIACVPTLILPHMVGYYIGAFAGFEIKPSGWKLTPGDKRGNAQAKFHRIIHDACGFAGFVTDPATDIPRILRRE